MSPKRIVYFAHSLRSDWNNGNAHFLRGLLRDLGTLGHAVTVLEPADSWSYANLLSEGERGLQSLAQFAAVFAGLDVRTYASPEDAVFADALHDADIVIVHEWTEPALIDRVFALREQHGFRALFHDTHHRASSSPEQLSRLRVAKFDGVLVFGEALRRIYRERWGAERVWTLHEAADISVFRPEPAVTPERDLVWIGNRGDGERTEELAQFLLQPARALPARNALVHGVRYPQEGLDALAQAGVAYGGYLPNLDAPAAFARAKCTVHVPRRQYAEQLPGIPTIRVFEALACGIPLVSAPWQDTESLFCPHDFLWAQDTHEMVASLRELLRDDAARSQRAAAGLKTVHAHHTTMHRAEQLSTIFDEVLA
jgi:spore maturation protein CgeB